MADEIIRELWAIKDRSAKDAHYDIEALCRRLQARESRTSARAVDLSKRRRSRAAAGPR